MVLYILYIKADIEGIESIKLQPNANICLDIRNPISDYEIREKVVIDPTEFIEQDGNLGEKHNFNITWEGNKKKSVLTVLDPEATKTALKKSGKKGGKSKKGSSGGDSDPRMPRPYTEEDNGSYVPFIALECRGIEPYAFHPMGGEFVVRSEGGFVFDSEEVDLSEDDWADYDAENDISISISEFESKIDSV
mmetsp:Transcript_21822/g.27531  ORF Transcript_21822/g.27531 Transcript_21822/m.27531 type:complete len:192 (+) Transcript_21822:109-684(+)